MPHEEYRTTILVQHIGNVRMTNTLFEAASPEKKRVMLAQDVLRSLRADRLRAETNVYVSGDGSYEYRLTAGSPEDPVEPPWGCYVCAKGALFVARVDRLNKITVRDLQTYNDPSHLMLDLFEQAQLDLIEAAFEGMDVFARLSRLDGERAWYFSRQYSSDEDRLVAICENLVKNNGTFILPVPPGGVPRGYEDDPE